jgi:translocator protein
MQFYKNLFFSVFLCLGGGWLTGLVTRQGVKDWYHYLIHPIGTPPNIIFPIVWTILYVLMASSLALLLSSSSANKKHRFYFLLCNLF